MKTIIFTLLLTSSIAIAQTGTPPKAAGPCEQIKADCLAAGFVQGQAKKGSGLWLDCINPVMQGAVQPKNADLKLPTVDASVIAACKVKHPNFGEGGKGKKAAN